MLTAKSYLAAVATTVPPIAVQTSAVFVIFFMPLTLQVTFLEATGAAQAVPAINVTSANASSFFIIYKPLFFS